MKIVKTFVLALFAVVFASVTAHADIKYMLGSTPVLIKVRGSGSPVFFAPHDNENTAVAAALAVMAKHGGKLVELSHGGARNISFVFNGKKCSIDPNRIFTGTGIVRTLGACQAARLQVADFAAKIRSQLRGGRVIAVHNNAGGAYSFKSYVKGDRNTADTYSGGKSTGDFLLVTSRARFNQAKAKGFNVVLQSRSPKDDGSFSVFMAGSDYVNVEARSGDGAIQRQMIESVF